MRQTRRASLLPKHRAVQFGFWVAAGGLFSSCHGVFIEIHEACPHTHGLHPMYHRRNRSPRPRPASPLRAALVVLEARLTGSRPTSPK
jgi:hypothetical protein